MITLAPCRQVLLARRIITHYVSKPSCCAQTSILAQTLRTTAYRSRTQIRHHTSSTSPKQINWAQEITRSPNSSTPPTQQIEIESAISSLPLTRYLRSPSSPYDEKPLYPPSLPPSILDRNLVSGSLFHPEKIPHNPPVFTYKPTTAQKDDESPTPAAKVVAFFYLGTHLCGHPGFIHGGIHFILFDNIFARCAGVMVKSGSVMTANLNIDYRKPALPDRIYVVRTEVEKVEGKKVWLRGSITSLPGGIEYKDKMRERIPASDDGVSREEEEDGVVVAEATALFIEPKFAGGEKGSDGLWRND